MALKINIISAGSTDKKITPLIESYEKNIQKYADINWMLVPTSTKDQENKLLKAKLTDINKYVVLDETGDCIATSDIAKYFEKTMSFDNGKLTFVLGGAYGLDQSIIENAQAAWAFGKITLPHQLARLLLIEQIYRGFAIIHNHPYHHQ